jgi:hypothetical protein
MRPVVLALALVAVVTACASGGGGVGGGHITSRPGARVSARVVLGSRTITAGSAVAASVIVDNNSGRAIRVTGCLGLFQVVLTSSTYHPDVAWPLCAQTFTIPVGQSSYRVKVEATYSSCGQDGPQGTLKSCLPGNRIPPLPPGRYHARLFQAGHVVAVPAPIPVRVTPPRQAP